MTCGSVLLCTVGAAVCYCRSSRPPQSHVGGERGRPWWMSASLTHHLYAVGPRQSQSFRLVRWFSSCPSLSLHRPSRPRRNTHGVTHEGPRSPQQVETTLALLVVRPVHVVVEVNAQVFVLLLCLSFFLYYIVIIWKSDYPFPFSSLQVVVQSSKKHWLFSLFPTFAPYTSKHH